MSWSHHDDTNVSRQEILACVIDATLAVLPTRLKYCVCFLLQFWESAWLLFSVLVYFQNAAQVTAITKTRRCLVALICTMGSAEFLSEFLLKFHMELYFYIEMPFFLFIDCVGLCREPVLQCTVNIPLDIPGIIIWLRNGWNAWWGGEDFHIFSYKIS